MGLFGDIIRELTGHTPNTSEYSKSHTSDGHSYRHVDEYSYDSRGEKASETHGVELSSEMMDKIDSEYDS